jgi:uncharacterized membrane protein (UPF0182 family)
MSEPLFRSMRGGRLLVASFLGLLFVLLLGRWIVGMYVDFLWFSSLGAADVYLTQLTWEWGARLLVGAVTVLFTWICLRLVARTLAGLQVRRRFGDLVIQEQLPEGYVRWGIAMGCLFVGFWFATAVPRGTGLQGMLLLNADTWGETEPILGLDVGFYVFVLPVLRALSGFGLILALFLGVISAAGYTATGSIGWRGKRLAMDDLSRLHLGILAGVLLLLLSARFYLMPYALLLEGNSGVQEIFGYADHEARMPAYRMLGFLSTVTAGAVFWGAYRGRLLPAAAGGAALAIGALALAQVYPSMIQRFQVQPNELARETPYIEHSVRATRVGFGLRDMDRRRFEYEAPKPETWDSALPRLGRLPVWTEQTLLTTFRQLEARFQYYDFHQVAIDRYGAGDDVQPVAVSVREVDPTGIPDANWQNLHLREHYISGRGAVAGLLHRRTPEGRIPMFLTAIPPEFRPGPEVPEGFHLARPSVYVGTSPQLYAVINPSEDTFLGPTGAPGVPGVDYPEGIPMGSVLRTAAFAWWAQDANLLFSSEVDSDSRLLYRREVRERVSALAPFLYLPEAPYPVVDDGRIVWVLEAFTWSSSYPLSKRHPIPGQREVSYLRNSVKATVDAVTGETRLYVADPTDPILQAYRRGFPSLFHDVTQVPAGIRDHFRYSRYYLEAQSAVLTRYHQEEPQVFHGQQDRWAEARELGVTAPPGAVQGGVQDIPYRAEYSLLELPGEDRESYVLSTLFVPQGRDNLASFMAARWSPERGSELILWDVPVEEQIRGPSQIEAMIEQDPEISEQFALWRQSGSQVWTGHLHLVPVESALLYMEPIFLAAEANAIPEIRRFVVSDGQRVVMRTTMEEAVGALAFGLGVGDGEDGAAELGSLPAPSAPASIEEALRALESAESRLRDGDWEGFGAGLSELRRILEEHLGDRLDPVIEPR